MSRSKKDIQPYWRPNFVNSSGLPDIKVVRTDFIINFVSMLLMLLVGFYVLQREYRAYALSQTIDDMEQRIRIAAPDDSSNLKLSQEFRDSAAHVAELEKFYAAPLLAHEFLKQLFQMRPEKLIFKQLSLTESLAKEGTVSTVTYRINISGEVSSPPVLNQFKEKLSTWEPLQYKGYILYVDEDLPGRDADTGIWSYTLEITLSPAKPDKPEEAEGVGV